MNTFAIQLYYTDSAKRFHSKIFYIKDGILTASYKPNGDINSLPKEVLDVLLTDGWSFPVGIEVTSGMFNDWSHKTRKT